jgi:hypothetical protein
LAEGAQPNLAVETNPNKMMRFNLILLALLLAWGVAKVIREAPEGYEDDNGFHFA